MSELTDRLRHGEASSVRWAAEVEIDRLEADNVALRDRNVDLSNETVYLKAEVEQLSAALDAVLAGAAQLVKVSDDVAARIKEGLF